MKKTECTVDRDNPVYSYNEHRILPPKSRSTAFRLVDPLRACHPMTLQRGSIILKVMIMKNETTSLDRIFLPEKNGTKAQSVTFIFYESKRNIDMKDGDRYNNAIAIIKI